MSFDLQTNNCWHDVLRQYQAYWGAECPVQQEQENPAVNLQIHRFALRLVKHFGIAHQPQDGCIVMMSAANVIHHFGFYQDGLIHSFTEYGHKRVTEQQLMESGIGPYPINKIVYLNTEFT